jgi:hypothetical protein
VPTKIQNFMGTFDAAVTIFSVNFRTLESARGYWTFRWY